MNSFKTLSLRNLFRSCMGFFVLISVKKSKVWIWLLLTYNSPCFLLAPALWFGWWRHQIRRSFSPDTIMYRNGPGRHWRQHRHYYTTSNQESFHFSWLLSPQIPVLNNATRVAVNKWTCASVFDLTTTALYIICLLMYWYI